MESVDGESVGGRCRWTGRGGLRDFGPLDDHLYALYHRVGSTDRSLFRVLPSLSCIVFEGD